MGREGHIWSSLGVCVRSPLIQLRVGQGACGAILSLPRLFMLHATRHAAPAMHPVACLLLLVGELRQRKLLAARHAAQGPRQGGGGTWLGHCAASGSRYRVRAARALRRSNTTLGEALSRARGAVSSSLGRLARSRIPVVDDFGAPATQYVSRCDCAASAWHVREVDERAAQAAEGRAMVDLDTVHCGRGRACSSQEATPVNSSSASDQIFKSGKRSETCSVLSHLCRTPRTPRGPAAP